MKLTQMAPAMHPNPSIKATREAVGKPTQGLISWKCKERSQVGAETMGKEKSCAAPRNHVIPSDKTPEETAWTPCPVPGMANWARRPPHAGQKREPTRNS